MDFRNRRHGGIQRKSKVGEVGPLQHHENAAKLVGGAIRLPRTRTNVGRQKIGRFVLDRRRTQRNFIDSERLETALFKVQPAGAAGRRVRQRLYMRRQQRYLLGLAERAGKGKVALAVRVVFRGG